MEDPPPPAGDDGGEDGPGGIVVDPVFPRGIEAVTQPALTLPDPLPQPMIEIRQRSATPRSLRFQVYTEPYWRDGDLRIEYCRGTASECRSGDYMPALLLSGLDTMTQYRDGEWVERSIVEETLESLDPREPIMIRARYERGSEKTAWVRGNADNGKEVYTAPTYKRGSPDQERRSSRPECRVEPFDTTPGLGYAYDSSYERVMRKCRIMYSPPNRGYRVSRSVVFHTTQPSCINAVMNHGSRFNSLNSYEAPIYQVSEKLCSAGSYTMDVSYHGQHCFMVETLEPSTCRAAPEWVCFSKCL